jgi:lipoyl-dependent peroxiredoxin
MATRTADAEWTGDIQSGGGRMRLGSGAFEGPFDFRSRMEQGAGTNPEELIGAAHAGCFSMAFAAQLGGAGFKPDRIATNAKVHFNKAASGWTIERIELNTEASIPEISEADFQRLANEAKANCPVSRALTGVQIELKASLT